jgi:hypothetical protein
LPGIDAGFVAQTEQWLGRWPQEAQAYFTAGAACAEMQLWGKAQQHLQKAIQSCSEDERRLRGQIHAALAQLLEGIERKTRRSAIGARRRWISPPSICRARPMNGSEAAQAARR